MILVKYKCVLVHLWCWCTLKMAHWREWSVCIRFCFKLGQNTAQTFWDVESTFWRRDRKNTSFWVVFQVLEGLTYVDDAKCSVYPSTCKMWKCGSSKGTFHWTEELLTMKLLTCSGFHLRQLGRYWKTFWTCHFATKFLPHLLNEKQKDIHGNTWQAVPHPPSRNTSFISQNWRWL